MDTKQLNEALNKIFVEYDKEAVRHCLEYALEVRRRVKEQPKKIGGMEFYDAHFSTSIWKLQKRISLQLPNREVDR